MCGFVGWYSMARRGGIDENALRRATNLLAHRGPNDEAYYFSPEFSAGFRRLSILDLSERGRQPMSDESGRYWLVFNGEIYNYRELRADLVAEGWTFHTGTDSEVLLKAYTRWGAACLSRLNGMFAFLIWDEEKRELFGARDRFGEKPLYYACKSGAYSFASEIKALFPLLGSVPDFHPGIVRQYLQFGKADFSSDTFYRGIHALPAAHCFLLRDDCLVVSRYWRLAASEDFRGNAVEAFGDLFLDSIRLRTRSDVPVGTCLSGGLDSGSIVCGLTRVAASGNGNVTSKTFTASFPEYDETPLVDEVNAISGSTGFAVTPAPQSLDILEEMLWYHDEPFHSFAAYASYEVMRLAKREGVTVLLNGQGADELLAGYGKFFPYYVSHLLGSGRIWASAISARQARPFSRQSATATLIQAVKIRMQEIVSETPLFRARARLLQSREGRSESCLSAEFLHEAQGHTVNELTSPIHDRFKRRLENEATGCHLPLYLRVEDRNSMAHSLESRLPFLDHRLAELVFSIPSSYFMRGGYNKYLLRESMRGILPESVRDRREKFGFPIPQNRWMASRLRPSIEALLHSPDVDRDGVFDVTRLRRKFREETTQAESASAVRWNFWFRVASFLVWLQVKRRHSNTIHRSHRDDLLNVLCVDVNRTDDPRQISSFVDR